MKGRYVITFKENEREQQIKKHLSNKLNATAYIKELIYNDMIGQGIAYKYKVHEEKKDYTEENKDVVIENSSFDFDPTDNPF